MVEYNTMIHETRKIEMCMMTSSNGTTFRVTGPLCGEFTGHRWIPLPRANYVELWCFLWSVPWINGWVNNREAGDLRCHRAHYDVIVMRTLVRHWTYKEYPITRPHGGAWVGCQSILSTGPRLSNELQWHDLTDRLRVARQPGSYGNYCLNEMDGGFLTNYKIVPNEIMSTIKQTHNYIQYMDIITKVSYENI